MKPIPMGRSESLGKDEIKKDETSSSAAIELVKNFIDII